MPRIVSGVREDFEDPGIAFLAGAERATQRGKEQRAAQMEQMRLGLQIQKAQRDYEVQKAKALQDVNARVQMGDVQAMQQQALEAQLANRPLEEKFVERLGEMGKGITDPKARAAYIQLAGGAMKSMQRQKEDQALQTGVDRLRAKGLLPEAKEGEVDPFTLRRQGGEEVETLLSDMATMEQEQTLANMATQKNTEAIAQLEQLIASSPPSDGRLMAEYRLQALKDDPTKLTQPGSSAEVGRLIQNDLLTGQNQIDAEQLKRQKAIAASQAEQRKLLREDENANKAFAAQRAGSGDPLDFGPGAFSRYNAFWGQNPEKFEDPGKGHEVAAKAAQVKAEKEKRYPAQPVYGPPRPPGGIAPAAPDAAPAALAPEDTQAIVQDLMARGIPLTPTNLSEARRARASGGG